MAISANKGEWSELYVLFKLLGDKKLFAGDGHLNKLSTYYPIIQIIRDELSRHMVYSIDEKRNIVIITENGKEIVDIDVKDFLDNSKKFFSYIDNGGTGKGAFTILELNDFLNKIHCEKVKAKSQDKADIHIVIHDFHTGIEQNLGFSIKSEAGSKATLLNASKSTIFNYKVADGLIKDEIMTEINGISSKSKVQDRVRSIYNSGNKLLFSNVANKTFENNLIMIDSNLPSIVGWMLADSYNHRNMDLFAAVERVQEANPMKYDISCNHNFYEYKIKSLLTSVALGMIPSKTWNGRYEATGGYIVVKADGDVICFHIYDRNLLEDYLLHNTKFDTPKSEINEPIIRIEENGDQSFTLGLQIRFK